MCIIIQGNPKNVSKKILKNAYSNNPHGLGVMYFDNDSQLIQDKIYPKNFSDVKKFFKKHNKYTFALILFNVFDITLKIS